MAITLLLFFIISFISCKDNAHEIETEEENEPFIMESMEFWTASRSYPNKDLEARNFTPAYNKLHQNMEMKALQMDLVTTAPWKALAPFNFAGRILTMAVSPANANTMFVGSASGGIWKTTTGGNGAAGGINWTYIPTGFPVLGVGAIVINPQNANEIYAGTGEVYNRVLKVLPLRVISEPIAALMELAFLNRLMVELPGSRCLISHKAILKAFLICSSIRLNRQPSGRLPQMDYIVLSTVETTGPKFIPY